MQGRPCVHVDESTTVKSRGGYLGGKPKTMRNYLDRDAFPDSCQMARAGYKA
jgi:hypothetical protein